MQYDDVCSRQVFNEVAIAQFSDFQIAIPSTTHTIPRKIFSTWVPLPKRLYHTKGGVIWDKQLSFSLSELRIQNLFSKSSIFPELKRLAVGVPISFEIQSSGPLPRNICRRAMLTCQISEKEDTYCSVFRDVPPQFVKIFPCQSIMHLTDQIDFFSLLKEKK